MLADYNFYQNEYKGIVIADADSYGYFGERASDELALYSNKAIFSEDETAGKQLKRCACRVAEILYNDFRSSKHGQRITSESVAGYYTVSLSASSYSQVKAEINTAVKLYIGKYILGAKKVLW